MTIESAQLDAVRPLCEGAKVLSEGGVDYVSLPGLKVSVGGAVRTLDGLLCPQAVGGYSTRLYLSQPVPERQQNWTTIMILGRTWHTWSWNNVPASIPLPQMLLEHLTALR